VAGRGDLRRGRQGLRVTWSAWRSPALLLRFIMRMVDAAETPSTSRGCARAVSPWRSISSARPSLRQTGARALPSKGSYGVQSRKEGTGPGCEPVERRIIALQMAFVTRWGQHRWKRPDACRGSCPSRTARRSEHDSHPALPGLLVARLLPDRG
jgi:hypothetical protein